MEIEIDFSEVKDVKSMHEVLKERLGFPDFYGKNVNALIDCLSSIRYPDDNMMNISIGKDQTLSIIVKSIPMENEMIVNNFLISIRSVNQQYVGMGEVPPISLVLI